MFRTGNGFDVHRFAAEGREGASITLGGVKIPHTHVLLAHSDGDVLVHALCDALLGALAFGDIGQHFPDTDPQYKDIDSLGLLDRVYTLISDAGWFLNNADITIIAEAPRLSEHKQAMREVLAATLDESMDKISIKATTSEGLGFTGRGEGIAVMVSVLLQEQS
tara:strand:+ start:59811 stop:60302 length:492 start_codon:yes stop_codon:yes gene_type:complete